MRVIVELYGGLRSRVGGDKARFEVDVAEGATVGDLMAQVGVRKEEPWTASLDGKIVARTAPLVDGCHLVVYPFLPMEGGQ